MTSFTEANTIEAFLCHLLSGKAPTPTAPTLKEGGETYQVSGKGIGWTYLPPTQIPRQPQDVFVEPFVRDALIRLNPEIAANPDHVEQVLYRLRAIVLSVRSDGLIRANEAFTTWLRGDHTMPFGPNHQHTPVHLIDFTTLTNNHYIVTNQYTFRAGPAERRADLILLVNGFPLILIEAKTPVREAISWVDGALQIHDDYEKTSQSSSSVTSSASPQKAKNCATDPSACPSNSGVPGDWKKQKPPPASPNSSKPSPPSCAPP
jgi:type I restriction enzyme R subunit